jgi:Zn-dependent protease
MDRLILGLEWYVVFLFSIVLHEAAHAFAALRLGDPTAYHGGQVTLDPVPHIRREPFGTAIVPIVSFLLGGWMIGWASAPYDRHWAMRRPRRAAVMALAGPVSNLLLVIAAAASIRAGIALGFFLAPERLSFTSLVVARAGGTASWAAVMLSILFTLNLVFLVFNLIPLPPLDGSGVIAFFMSPDTARRYLEFTSAPMLSFAGLMISWRVFGQVFDPIRLIAVNLLYLGHAHYG